MSHAVLTCAHDKSTNAGKAPSTARQVKGEHDQRWHTGTAGHLQKCPHASWPCKWLQAVANRALALSTRSASLLSGTAAAAAAALPTSLLAICLAKRRGRPYSSAHACMQSGDSVITESAMTWSRPSSNRAMCSCVTTTKDRKGPKDTRRRVTLTHQDPASLPWLPCSAGTSAVRTL
jgi:hypothetical protein